jgi:uncharacterized protein
MNVAVLGASPNPERYSHMAVQMLKEAGHSVFPIHPRAREIAGQRVYRALGEVESAIHTVTVYVSPGLSDGLTEEILSARPQRVIFNPGAENGALADRLKDAGVRVVEACTLVLLRTGQFEAAGMS